MKLRANPLNFETGGLSVVILNKEDVESLGVHALDRVKLTIGKKELTAIVDVSERFAKRGEVVTNEEVSSFFKIKLGDELEIKRAPKPDSVEYIKEKIERVTLNEKKIRAIVNDVVERNLSDIELSAFVAALDMNGLSMDEAEYLSKAMVETGKKLRIPGKKIVDKHSVGGIPGDKTSLIAVPIIAAAGFIIPKTSSRAITSPAGSADRMEVLAPVNLSADEIRRVVRKTRGCLVWGGALDLAPADDAFIRIEYPLGIDPLMLPSIISKKKAVGAQHVIIDIPTGRGAKIKTVGSAKALSEKFIELGKRLGIEVSCAITFGEQPLGHAIGPALEAREALMALQGDVPEDVLNKVCGVVGTLFRMMSTKADSAEVLRILRSGKAEKKFREIIDAQGGNPKIKPSDISIGSKKVELKSDCDGRVLWMQNAEIAEIAREAGAPKDQGAGLLLGPKVGHSVKKGDMIMTIYSNNTNRLNSALKLAEQYQPIVIGKHVEDKMLLDSVPSRLSYSMIKHRRIFMLER